MNLDGDTQLIATLASSVVNLVAPRPITAQLCQDGLLLVDWVDSTETCERIYADLRKWIHWSLQLHGNDLISKYVSKFSQV